MRLISFNYSQEKMTQVTSSSQANNFPVSNIKHEHRSKHWRSSGYFEIRDNNTFSFIEGVTTYTATVAEGNYSTQALINAIKQAMESEGNEEYSVTFSQNTGLWSISSESEFELINSSTNLLNTYLGYLTEDESGTEITGAKISIHTSEWIVFDLKSTEEINSVVLMWPKEDGTRLSTEVEIRVQANATNEWSSPAVDQALTITDSYQIASHYFTSSESYRFWRVVIKDPENPYNYVSLGVVVLGQSENVINPDNGFTYTLNDLSVVSSNNFGNTYTDVYPQQAELLLNFNNMDYVDGELLQRVYRFNGTTKPIFVVIDPSEAKFYQDDFAIYGKFSSSFSSVHVVSDLFNSSLSIKEIT